MSSLSTLSSLPLMHAMNLSTSSSSSSFNLNPTICDPIEARILVKKKSLTIAIPPSILIHCFSYLNRLELFKLSKVCEGLKILSKNPSLWEPKCRKLGMGNNSAGPQEIARMEILPIKLVTGSVDVSVCNLFKELRMDQKMERHLLPISLFEGAKPYIDEPKKLEDLPRASSGKTRVYFPKELPIVLKQSGSPANQKRFGQMKQARDICEKSGYENLVIPRARVYGDFIVESRLPITMHGTKKQIGHYIENREKFTDAVKEFTGFLCQSHFGDITGGRDPYGTLSKTPVGRYDNIALYVQGDQGRIGLIDLEEFTPECSKYQEEWCFFRCRDAVHLFPHHLNEIMNIAKKFDSDIEAYRGNLELEREEALKRFKLTYEDHLDFVRKKGITFENPIAFETLGATRIEQLKKAIEKELRKEHEGDWIEGCLGKNPDETLICFNEKAFPQILEATYKLINNALAFNMESERGRRNISTNAQLLSVRTLELDEEDFVNSPSNSKLLEMLSFKYRHKARSCLNILLDIILKELEQGKEIAYYNPKFGYGGYATKCIFC